ncbi:MAG: FMN-binding protein, partial [Clostridia bacterium]|nr:FMN-binding protein [Clostridia bacterium]
FLPKIIRYAVPIMLTNLLQLLFNAADLVVVGQFAGKTAPLSVAKGNDERNAHTIDAITSATITSKSVTGAANDIMAALDSVLIPETEGGAQ